MNNLHNARVAYQLLSRDMVVIKKRLPDDLVNVAILVSFFSIVFGVLGPLMGLPVKFIADTFIGNIVGAAVFIGFVRASNDLSDLTYNKFFDYRRILPISGGWLMFVHIISYVIHMMLVIMPILLAGKLILGSRLDFSHAHWGLYAIMHPLVLWLIASFFVCIVFTASFYWFRFNIWQRILTPLNQFGCVFYSWKKAFLFSPKIAFGLLFNPLTYCNEGLRATLLGTQNYLNPVQCIAVVFLTICGLNLLLVTVVRKKLDWV
jgi:hypothetical protein